MNEIKSMKSNQMDNIIILLYIGLAGSILRVFRESLRLSREFLGVNNSIFYDIIPMLSDILFFGILFVIIGFIGISTNLTKGKQPSTILLSILLIKIFLFEYADINLTWDSFIIINFVFLIPLLVFFSYNWKRTSIVQALIPLIIIREIIRSSNVFLLSVVIPEVSIQFPDAIPGLFDAVDLIYTIIYIFSFFYYLLIVIWFWRIIKAGVLRTEKEQPVKTSTTGKPIATDTQISTGVSTIYDPIELPVIGEVYGVPRLGFWCKTCDKSVKVNDRGMSKDKLRQKHSCPTCQNNLLVFYVPITKKKYLNFLYGLIIFGGGLITFTIELNLGSYGYEPMLVLGTLSMIEFVVGSILLYKITSDKLDGPPIHATENLEPVENSLFFREVIILVVIALIGGFLLYSINMGILAILFA